MVKIKALRDYKDTEANRYVVKNEEYIVTRERATIITQKGFAIVIEELKETAVVIEKAKRNAKK